MKKMVSSPFGLGAALLWFSISSAFAADYSITAGEEYMSWREYESGLLLEETGSRPYAQIDISFPLAGQNDSRFVAMGRVYGGEVKYDGQYQDGTPLQSKTGYLGGQAEFGLDYAEGGRAGGPMRFVFLGGVDAWERNLKGDGGYIENYQLLYLRLGLKSEARKRGWSGRGGIYVPLETNEHIKGMGEVDSFELHPKGQPSLYAGVSWRHSRDLEVGFDYHSYRFDASDPAALSSQGIPLYFPGGERAMAFQPRSEIDMFRLYARFGF